MTKRIFSMKLARASLAAMLAAGVAHAGCNTAISGLTVGGHIFALSTELAKLPREALEAEAARRGLDEALLVAEHALKQALGLTEIPELPHDLEDLQRRYPWLNLNADHPIRDVTLGGFRKMAYQEDQLRLWSDLISFIGRTATPVEKARLAKHLYGSLDKYPLSWREQTRLDQMIDQVLGLKSDEVTRELQTKTDEEIREKYGQEQTWFKFGNRNLLTPYFEFQLALQHLDPKPGQKFVDLGSGMGRQGIYMGIMHPKVEFVGYEIVTERVKEGERVARELGLDSVRFVEQNMADKSFAPGPADFYYAFNPVSGPTWKKILGDIKAGARQHSKPFKIVVSGPADYAALEDPHSGFKEITPPKRFDDDDFARIFMFDPRQETP